MSITTIEEEYKNYGRVLYIANEKQEMRVTLDIGPRVISYNLIGYENMFCTDTERVSSMSDDKFSAIYGKDKAWYLYGGHRFWISPEDYYTYYPDNDKVEYVRSGNAFLFTPPVQAVTGWLCQVEIIFDENEAKATVNHILTNKSQSEKTASIWALSVTAAGGKAIMKQADNSAGWTPNRYVSFWDYSNLADKRFSADDKYFVLRQDVNATVPFKLGVNNAYGSVITVNNGCVFKKTYGHIQGAQYPDGCSSTELYTCNFMLEVETLSPLYTLKPGETKIHTENWSLVPEASDNLEDLAKHL